MNRSFRRPLVETARGGAARGATRLTRAGTAVAALYREMEERGLEAAAPPWRRLRAWLKP
jgi:molybdate transport system regulatory protein